MGFILLFSLLFHMFDFFHKKKKNLRYLKKSSEVGKVYLLLCLFFSESNLSFGLRWEAHLRGQLVHSVWCYCFSWINISHALLRLCLICLTSGLTQRYLWVHLSGGWLLNDWKNNWKNASLGTEEKRRKKRHLPASDGVLLLEVIWRLQIIFGCYICSFWNCDGLSLFKIYRCYSSLPTRLFRELKSGLNTSNYI